MITIATVLRSGGEYEPRHVVALRDMCRRFVPMHRFICLTDKPNALPLETIELLHDWPGWWSKMEIFRLRGPVLYLDLDTVIVRDISPVIELAGDDEFVILRDFYRGRMNKAAMQSSMMLWSGDMSRLYRAFREDDLQCDLFGVGDVPAFTPLHRRLPSVPTGAGGRGR